MTRARVSRVLHAALLPTSFISKSAVPLLSVDSTGYSHVCLERGSSFCHYSRYSDYAVGFSRLDGGGAVIPLRRSIALDAARSCKGTGHFVTSTNGDWEEGSRSKE